MKQFICMGVFASTVCVAVIPNEAYGIIRRHDVDASAYLSFGAMEQFHAVGEIGFRTPSGGFAGASAVLIDPNWVLTSAHRISQDPDFNWEFRNNDVIHGIDEIIYHPGYDGHPNGNTGQDLALVRLSSPIHSVAHATLAQTSLGFGDQVALVGYGGIGDGLGNDWTFTTERWAATNNWDFRPNNSEYYTTIFDSPENGALEMEGTTTNGDTGGGVYRFENGQWELVAIASHNLDVNGNGMFGDYGDLAKHTRLDRYMPWIQSTIPTPGSVLVLGLGMVGTARRRRS